MSFAGLAAKWLYVNSLTAFTHFIIAQKEFFPGSFVEREMPLLATEPFIIPLIIVRINVKGTSPGGNAQITDLLCHKHRGITQFVTLLHRQRTSPHAFKAELYLCFPCLFFYPDQVLIPAIGLAKNRGKTSTNTYHLFR